MRLMGFEGAGQLGRRSGLFENQWSPNEQPFRCSQHLCKLLWQVEMSVKFSCLCQKQLYSEKCYNKLVLPIEISLDQIPLPQLLPQFP